MKTPASGWITRVVADLRSHSAQLIDVGLAPAYLATRGEMGAAPWHALARAIEQYADAVPLLLRELEAVESETSAEWVPSPIPQQGIASRVPGDYLIQDGRAIPQRWLRPVPLPALPIGPMCWLMGVAAALQVQLETHSARLAKQVEGARLVRAGEDEYALADSETLDTLLSHQDSVGRLLVAAQELIRRTAGHDLPAVDNLPMDFPRTATWQNFRYLASTFSDPAAVLGSWIGATLAEPVAVADVPFLYQRWVGLQLLKSAERLGWTIYGDTVGALFLGGNLTLKREGAVADLWVEPRLSRLSGNEIGWRTDAGDITPDFLLVSGESGRRQAALLDATLSTNKSIADDKGRYRLMISGDDVRTIAGVRSRPRPARAWAAAPVRGLDCVLGDSEGFTGIVPLNSFEASFPGLDHWMADALNCRGS